MKTKKIVLSFAFVLVLFSNTFVITNALSYGGIGGKPAMPDPKNPRTQSIFIFEIKEGGVKDNAVLVINNTNETKTLLVYATDSQKSSDGSFACKQYLDEKTDVGSWITLEQEEVLLAKNTSKEVKFTVKVPEDANVGESNGCIMIQEKIPPDSNPKSGVSLSFRTGLRVVVTVPGEQTRELKLNNFDAFEADGLIRTNMSIENTGNVSIDADIKLYMDSVFGTNIIATSNEYPILRGDISTYNFEIEKPIWGGFFNVYAHAEYDPSMEASVGVDTDAPPSILSTNKVMVFIMPSPEALVIEGIVIATVLGMLYMLYRRVIVGRHMKKNWVDHIVTAQDTLQGLADKHATSWKLLVRANALKPPFELTPGSVIKVPGVKKQRA